ncbi:MAG: chloride channel protein [Chloroflexi bacterium]|nr:chloride channel protein [Chloroflexota bacterium]
MPSQVGPHVLWLRSEFALSIGLAVGVGALAGLGAVGLIYLIRGFEKLFFDVGGDLLGFMGRYHRYHVVLLPALGGLLVGLLLRYLGKGTRGQGVPEVMKAIATQGGRIGRRAAAVRAVAAALTLGSGGSAGREGPVVHLGSTLGSTVGQWLRLPEPLVKTLVAAGAAGGISATFNAPIAGVFFAVEVVLGSFALRSFSLVVLSSVVASVISHSFFGDFPAFPVPQYELVSGWEVPLYIGLGLVAAPVALAFVLCLYRAEGLFAGWKRLPGWSRPALGGLAVGFIGLYSVDLLGTGHGGIARALEGQMALLALLALIPLKVLATSLTLGSGGVGGIFMPSLFIGAALGGAYGTAVHRFLPDITAPPGAYALAGMAAVFAAAARAPLTSILVLFEMSRSYSMILPLMTAAVIATVLASRLYRESIYTLQLKREGVDMQRPEGLGAASDILVQDAMTVGFPTVSPQTSVPDLITRFARTGHHGFPVVDDRGVLVGMVTLLDVQEVVASDRSALTVDDICTKRVVVARPDQSLREVLAQLGAKEVGRIPVVDPQTGRVLGVLRRSDIIGALSRAEAGQAARSDS